MFICIIIDVDLEQLIYYYYYQLIINCMNWNPRFLIFSFILLCKILFNNKFNIWY